MTRWLSLHAPASGAQAPHAQSPHAPAPHAPAFAVTASRRAVAIALLLAATLLVAGAAAPARAQSADRIYDCEGPNGTRQFQNTQGKGCRLMDLPPLNAVPAPKLPAAANRAASPTAAAGVNRSFPRVDPAAQRDRDEDRQRLLSDELKREQERLAGLKREFNDGEPERRGDERNYQKYLDRVEALRQEIGRAETSVSSLERELGTSRN